MPGVVGLTLCKINNVYEVDVVNASWDIKKAIATHHTGKGLQLAEGLEVATGSFDEVIPREGATNWRNLTDFSVEILDKQTKEVIAAFTGCKWSDLAGSSNTSSASTTKRVAWSATEVVKG